MTSTIELDEQFAAFCEFADAMGPRRAAAKLRAFQSRDVIDRLVERFEAHVGRIRVEGAGRYVDGGGRLTWYPGPLPDDRCWPPLPGRLRAEEWEEENLANLDNSSSTIVGLLAPPYEPEFRAKGLVLGHVQAGKTTNYTAVMAKAADRGYRLFIVLSGIHNELRSQTHRGLRKQLLELNPDFWHALTEDEHDFHPPANAAAYFGEHARQPVLCVVKKNATVLKKLINWLGDAEEQLKNCPALVIDDEADQATVATKTINPLIRRLLDRLPKVCYVGYTATPFANLLIDPSADDLYPEDFIVDLPKPRGHFGTEVLFGREPLDGEDPSDVDDGYDMIRIVPDDEVQSVRPVSNADVGGFAPRIAGELRRAVLWFWLATAARRVREKGSDRKTHSTMLIHTSVRVAVHNAFRDPLEALRRSTLERLRSGDGELLAELESMWTEETRRVPAHAFGRTRLAFDDIRGALVETIEASRVVLDNSSSEDRLDYSKEEVTVVAVGGNTLSRGLTLEGLVSSFFVRSTTAYDTLLQMGRWFGYRKGYEDLPRIWMTSELREWFRHIAGVEAEIRNDIARYMVDDVTPTTFAVRLRAHPALRITAAAKMRDAVVVEASYGGMRLQTRYFHADDAAWLRANQMAAKALVARLAGSARPVTPRAGATMWTDVDGDLVLEFLQSYAIHEHSLESDSRLVRDYIRSRHGVGALRRWNVALIGNPASVVGGFEFAPGVVVPKVIRARLKGSPPDAADIKTLMSRRDAAIDVPTDLLPEGELSEAAIKRLRSEHFSTTGLLTIYPIDAESRSARQGREPLAAKLDAIGIGIVFPEPPIGEDSAVYYAADLPRLRTADGYAAEIEDLDALEQE